MKEFSELIKSIEILRRFIQEIYVFGYKSRGDYDKKSGRTYDNGKRRIESYFDEMFSGVTDKNGKRVSILVNGDEIKTNPFYRVFKAKSFTDNDLILHFLIIDVLRELHCVTASEIIFYISNNSYDFPETLDIGILRLKLNEYVALGLLRTQKRGNKLYYLLSEAFDEKEYDWDMIKYFREVNPLGVIGSFITDRQTKKEQTYIKYKHRQLFGTLDSANLLRFLESIKEKKPLQITRKSKGETTTRRVIPLKVLINRQNGRQYLAAYDIAANIFLNYRLDHIIEVKNCDIAVKKQTVERLLSELEERFTYTWNVNFHSNTTPKLTEITIQVKEGENFILNRLYREGHGGEIQQLSSDKYKFSIRLYDPSEMIPWVKSFIGRIVDFSCEDMEIEERFYNDIKHISEEFLDE